MVDDSYPIGEDWPYPLCIVGADDTLIWANQALQEWAGQSLRRLVGKPLSEVVFINGNSQGILARSQNSSEIVTVRDGWVGRNQDDASLCEITAFPTDKGTCLSFRQNVREPRDARMGGQLVSGMGRMLAHELKNPLAGIRGAAQLLRDDVASEEGLALIDLISAEIDRIRRLADRMETLGDQDPDTTKRVNIHTILRQARRIIQSSSPDIVFTEAYDPSLPHAQGDADTLMQAILNLVKNAAEAVSGKGDVRLETTFRSGVTRKAKGGAKALSLPIEVRIIDSGPGIPTDLMSQIFQPFVTSKPEGQGLGLALVSKVANAHGGIVEVVSSPGQTIFSLLLPMPAAANVLIETKKESS